MKRLFIDGALILLGVCSAAFGLGSFLLPNEFIDGGIVGVSLLVAEVFHDSLSLLIVVFNIPFIYIGYRLIGKVFAAKTIVAIGLLALSLAVVPFPELTHDKLLVSIFGGCFLGLGIGFTMRGGGVLDGSEVLAVALSSRFSVTVGDFILALNIAIFSVAAFVLSVETALYAALTYFATSRMVDFVVEGVEEFVGVTIVSPHSEAIRTMIIHVMGGGVTIYNARGGYGSQGEFARENAEVVFTVITRLELNKLYAELDSIDPNAFITINSIKETRGGRVKRRELMH